MNKYELAVVVSAKLEDEERAATIEKVKNMVTKHGGTITNVDEWGKKRLAYEVRKMREAFYYFIQFDAEATVPAEIETRIRLMENEIQIERQRVEEMRLQLEQEQLQKQDVLYICLGVMEFVLEFIMFNTFSSLTFRRQHHFGFAVFFNILSTAA